MRAPHVRPILLTLALVFSRGAAAQGVTTDCASEELRGPVAEVVVVRIPFAQRGDAWVEEEPRVIRSESYDADCYFTERHYPGPTALHYTYWADAAGRGRRFESETVRTGGAPPPPPEPLPAEAIRPLIYAPDGQRGTLKETTYVADSNLVRGRAISRSGYLTERWTRTLDGEGRVVHEVRFDGYGERTYEASYDYRTEAPGVIVDYEHPLTSFRSQRTAGRTRYVPEATDEHGNWTRRTLYRWDEGRRAWEPREVNERRITYREEGR